MGTVMEELRAGAGKLVEGESPLDKLLMTTRGVAVRQSELQVTQSEADWQTFAALFWQVPLQYLTGV